MKTPYKLKTVALGVALLCTVVGSEALTLGRARGAVFVGQPLNLNIQVEFDPEEDSASFCFEADVFHADARQDPGGVRATFEAVPQARNGSVRVTSSTVVNEPVVTVYLRAGCGQKTTRRYVLLADLQSEIDSTVPVRVPQPVPLVSPPPEPAVLPPSAARNEVPPPAQLPGVQGKSRVERAESALRPLALEPKPAIRPPTVPKESARKSSKAPDVPRLKLEASELLAERDPSLKSSPQLAAGPAEKDPSRVQAAEIWRAIGSSPEERVRDWQRMQSLESDVKVLRELGMKNQQSLNELTVRLQQSQERYPDGLVYGLLALLIASFGAVAVMWRRRVAEPTGTASWWQGSRSSPETAIPNDGVAKVPDYPETREMERQPPPSEPKLATPVDIDLEFDDSVFAPSKPAQQDHQATIKVNAAEATQVLQRPVVANNVPLGPDSYPAPLTAAAHTARAQRGHDFGLSMPGTLRAINTEELFDIRQQADFFISLGQYDQAIQVLENCVEESGESSPLVYLDLLKIFHTLGRKIDYQQYREDFNLLFNGRVPEFASFNEEGHGIEAYVAVIKRITELWPTPEVIDVIEACIFRDPGDDLSQAFDLEAYRELLMLHTIAVTLSGGAAGGLNTNPGTLTRVPFKTYSTPTVEVSPTRPMEPLPELAIDFDLSSPQPLHGEQEGASDTESAPAAAVEFPVLHAVDTVRPVSSDEPAPSNNSGNLIDFDLPETPAKPR